MENETFYTKRLWWLALLIGGIFISLLIFFLLNRRDAGANLEISVVPDDAVVVIDGKEYRNGKNTVQPGTYMATANREGFVSLTQEVTITDTLQTLMFSLTPESEEAKQWAAKNQEAYSEAEAAGGEAALQQGQALRDRYPLVSKLPFDGSFYEINYAILDREKNTIYIRIDTTSPMGRQVALEQIKEWGFQPTDYQIVFPGLKNPLDPKELEIQGE